MNTSVQEHIYNKSLNPQEIELLERQSVDASGRVFIFQGKIYRGIKESHVRHFREMFECGLVQELMNKQLVPNTSITNLTLDGYGMILNHERVSPEIYPSEWTLAMLHSAALHVVQVAKIASSYGYTMTDCHTQNIMFSGCIPKYVDFGSFSKRQHGETGWAAQESFVETYIYPLKLAAAGHYWMGHLILRTLYPLRAIEYLGLRYQVFVLVPIWFKKAYFKVSSHLRIIALMPFERIEKIKNKNHKTIVQFIKPIVNFFSTKIENCLKKNNRMLEKLLVPERPSRWSSYYDPVDNTEDRFEQLVALINGQCIDAESLIDVAGNNGLLIELLQQKTNIKKFICVDVDEGAIDKGFEKIHSKPNSDEITFSCFDFMMPIGSFLNESPYSRYSSDIVVSMALTHHLMISQGYSSDQIAHRFSAVCNKYLFVEFMPYGLNRGPRDFSTPIPAGYSLGGFLAALKKHFKVLDIIGTDTPRILIFASKVL